MVMCTSFQRRSQSVSLRTMSLLPRMSAVLDGAYLSTHSCDSEDPGGGTPFADDDLDEEEDEDEDEDDDDEDDDEDEKEDDDEE